MFSFFRAIKFALQDILRNISLSFMTVLILILMLLSVNTLFLIQRLTQEAVNSVKGQVDVSIFFHRAVTDEQVNEIRKYVGSFPEVVDMVYYNRDEVLDQFRGQYADNKEVLASLTELGDNPLGPTLIVKTRDPGDYQKIITALNVPEYETIIEAKTFADTERAIARIHVITSYVERFAVGLTGLFAIIAFFIIFNTIRVAIYTHRVEIGIKRLVGATNWFIRSPYIIGSFLFSFISTLVTVVVVYGAVIFLDPYIAVLFERSGVLTDYYWLHIVRLVGWQFLAVLLLTFISSSLAMRRYLKV